MTDHNARLIPALLAEMQATRAALADAAELLRQQSALMQRLLEREQGREPTGLEYRGG
jgi:hypothetical protein